MGTESTSASPRLSIIVPVYGVEAYVAQCLDSILAYRGLDIEVVAVNDESPDGSAAILDTYAEFDPRLRVIHLSTNVGLGRARNLGLDQAHGDYIWFVDPDDWLPDGTIDVILSRLDDTNPDVLIIGHAEVFPDGSATRHTVNGMLDGMTLPISLINQPNLMRLAQSACTKIARRDYINDIGLRFWPGWYEDSSFSYPLLMGARSIDAITRICYCYRRHTPGGITSTLSTRHFEVFDQYERLFVLVDASNGAYDPFRPELFRSMLNHYLVILGNRWRLPTESRRAFFGQIAEHYERWRPAGGYPIPGGIERFKHRLVRHNTYTAYVSLRLVYQVVGQFWPRVPSQSPAAPHADLDPPAAPVRPPLSAPLMEPSRSIDVIRQHDSPVADQTNPSGV